MDIDDQQVPVPTGNHSPAAGWTPEDAARFLTSAIQEAQRPLTNALRQRSIAPGVFALVIVILVAAAAAVGWTLLDRLEKADNQADSARSAQGQALRERYAAEAKEETAAARLSVVEEEGQRLRVNLATENERLRLELANNRSGEEEVRRLRGENSRLRRQNELLRSQITGLEMEKLALARQLAAVKALAVPEEDGEENAVWSTSPGETPPVATPAEPVQKAPAEPIQKAPAEDPVEAVPEPEAPAEAEGAAAGEEVEEAPASPSPSDA
ncbi:MAG: hypothetical protein LBU79_10135, partial [Planctomycetota bacterium]|nr:hypothetical protein [Planctomycetota bacterium]